MRKIAVLPVLVTLLMAVFCGPCPVAADSPAIVFILDGSGSMWGRVEGTTKITAARKVLQPLLEGLPAGVEAGLFAYGHRRKGDCQDIEAVVPLGSGSLQALSAAALAIVPRGKTPIAASLTLVGDALRGRESAVTVVLISDGIETCGGDPCAVARTLREEGIQVVIHVVGFDVAGEAVEQLRCIAEKGGGSYFQADSATQLENALTQVRDHVVAAAPLPAPPAPPQPAVKTRTQRVKIAGPGTVTLDPAPWVRMPPYYWKLVDAETGKEVVRSQETVMRVKAGTYQVVWRASQHGARDLELTDVVTVESGGQHRVALQTGLRITLPEGLPAPYYFRLVDDERREIARFSETLEPQVVPAGSYRLIWRQTQHQHPEIDLGAVSLVPDQLNDLVLDTAVAVRLPEWLEPPYEFALVDAERREIRIREEVGVHLVAPGDYLLLWRQTQHGFSRIPWAQLHLPAHQITPVAIDSGLTFLAGDAPAPYMVRAIDASGERMVMKESWGPMPLPPGTYRIDLQQTQHGGSPATIVEGLEVASGQLLEIEF